ncbi:hypothetical protein [Burkholderia ambifaria]|uniref:hypothetical protein n=1 Tax=Burkholderia ambifaria TaxID=152480 RepID=UPI00158A2D14|nr:hypothetical protein [Burkholderia ambifaria]
MATTLIADLLANAQRDLGMADNVASEALSQTVKLLKAALPFMLAVRIVTGHLSPREIAREASQEPYTQILLTWFTGFATNPNSEIDDLTGFIGWSVTQSRIKSSTSSNRDKATSLDCSGSATSSSAFFATT